MRILPAMNVFLLILIIMRASLVWASGGIPTPTNNTGMIIKLIGDHITELIGLAVLIVGLLNNRRVADNTRLTKIVDTKVEKVRALVDGSVSQPLATISVMAKRLAEITKEQGDIDVSAAADKKLAEHLLSEAVAKGIEAGKPKEG